ncbi:complement component C1q receptor [Clarias gariepinus]|uniref:complement component C1q receptor n=1 Tax=Clarias gariepinus TaxID=13013 RepID=UPI00234DAD25|nr:complement component C1q receptor [Clarias gariepinus]
MLCAVIAVLFALLAAERAANATNKCTGNACFILHAEKEMFETAKENCNKNGGLLITVRNETDLDAVKSVLKLAGKLSVREKVWIGLKLSKGSCVLSDQGLYGFSWISGNPDSSYTNWGKEPTSTCTEERCVSISTSTEELKWIDGSCKERALYMCVYNFRGMCKPLVLAGPGEVSYTHPFLNVPLKPDGDLTMLPHATYAEINCTYYSDLNTQAVCTESSKQFVWEKPGPFCASDQRSCENGNGGCDQLCFNDHTGVRCGCKENHYLGDDKVTCFREDACRNSLCEHNCALKPTGIACTCKDGFELSENNVSCQDVDECTRDICKGHICHNKPGYYECECKSGFKDVDGVCEDIDECAESACPHHATCLNSEGSFSCDCSPGYRNYKEQCVDIDECLNRPCEDICRNTDGSYACSCGPDFRLAENGISCVPDEKRTTTSHDFEIILTNELDQQIITTIEPRLSTETSHQGVRKDGPILGSWVLVYALSAVIPLLLLITLTAVIAVHRWNRSRKVAKKQSVIPDSYCWVSSGYTPPLETQRNRMAAPRLL